MADRAKKPPSKITSISYAKYNFEDYVASVGGKVLSVFRRKNNSHDVNFEEVNYIQNRKGANSFVDVVWQDKQERLIATSLSNGHIILWKYDWTDHIIRVKTFEDCSRSINTIKFSPYQPNILYAGSQNGEIVLYDVVVGKNIFTFNSAINDAVRDLRFPYSETQQFATAHDNGSLLIWDARWNKLIKRIACHDGIAYSCDWHPNATRSSVIITAGRDQTIKVWDIASSTSETYSPIISTSAPVRKVRWRPGCDKQFASCAAWDFDINLWDLNRIYIPLAVLKSHSKEVSGLIWKDSNWLISSSAEKGILLEALKDAYIPAKDATPSSLGFSTAGYVCTSTRMPLVEEDRYILNEEDLDEGDDLSTFCDAYKFFRYNSSILTIHKGGLEDDEKVLYLAQHYWISRKPFGEICDHNGAVAKGLKLHHIAQAWFVLKILYENYRPNIETTDGQNVSISFNDNTVNKATQEGELKLANENSPWDDTTKDSSYAFPSAISDDDDSICEDYESRFSDFPLQPAGPMPTEAFEVNCVENVERVATMETDSQDKSDLPSSLDKYLMRFDAVTDLCISKPTSEMMEISNWQFSAIISDLLRFYADMGDVQTSVSMITVLGDRFDRSLIREETVVNWHFYYLELLSKFELWNKHNEIIKNCRYNAIQELSYSWPYSTGCSNCKRTADKAGYCCSCKRLAALCSVCHLPVKGNYVWCQGCGHGGHLHHMKEWMTMSSFCPTGCKHECEFN